MDELEEAIDAQVIDHLEIAAAEISRARNLIEDDDTEGDLESIRTWILGIRDEAKDGESEVEKTTERIQGGEKLVHILKEPNERDSENYLDNRKQDYGEDEDEEVADSEESNEWKTFAA